MSQQSVLYDTLGPKGRRNVRIELDEELLNEIADNTGGRYFRATDADGLKRVFQTIDQLEKTEIESKVRVIYSEMFPLILFIFPALLVVILGPAVVRFYRLFFTDV